MKKDKKEKRRHDNAKTKAYERLHKHWLYPSQYNKKCKNSKEGVENEYTEARQK